MFLWVLFELITSVLNKRQHHNFIREFKRQIYYTRSECRVKSKSKGKHDSN